MSEFRSTGETNGTEQIEVKLPVKDFDLMMQALAAYTHNAEYKDLFDRLLMLRLLSHEFPTLRDRQDQ